MFAALPFNSTDLWTSSDMIKQWLRGGGIPPPFLCFPKSFQGRPADISCRKGIGAQLRGENPHFEAARFRRQVDNPQKNVPPWICIKVQDDFGEWALTPPSTSASTALTALINLSSIMKLTLFSAVVLVCAGFVGAADCVAGRVYCGKSLSKVDAHYNWITAQAGFQAIPARVRANLPDTLFTCSTNPSYGGYVKVGKHCGTNRCKVSTTGDYCD
ncbi:hypothetical protein FB451DRAFT_1431793 [Mycena latifolia]|nr:hypothetical protein FB451DRAFT_1431793 [Mycena latifolia]